MHYLFMFCVGTRIPPKDLGHFLQQFSQATGSKFNSRKHQRLSAISVAINLELLNCDFFFFFFFFVVVLFL